MAVQAVFAGFMKKRIVCCLAALLLCLTESMPCRAETPSAERKLLISDGSVMIEELLPPAAEDGGETELEIAELPVPDYRDVSAEDWYYPALCWCESRGLLQDIPLGGVFQSDAVVTRAMFTSMLVRLVQPDAAWDGETVYTDVLPGSYYYETVSWAGSSGLASGYGDGSFHPGDLLTRQQMAALLARTAGYLGCDTTPTSSARFIACSDASSVSAWARGDVKWCLQTGVLNGTSGGSFAPQGQLTRGQAVQALWNLGEWLAGPDAEPRTSAVSASAPVQDTETHRSVQAEIGRIAAKYGADGVAVAYIRDGKVSDTFAYGAAVKGKTAMTADTKLRVASLSKILVGLAAHLSAEDGVMDLDADLGSYLGVSIRTKRTGDVVTPRSVLTHASSLAAAADGTPCDLASVRRRLTSSAATRSVVSGASGNWLYNNYAFDVLGMAVELAEQRTLDELLYEAVYGPLNIDAAFYSGEIDGTEQLAEIYRANGAVGLSYAYQAAKVSDGIPGSNGSSFAGGLTISAYDLGKIVALLANDGCYDGVSYISAGVVSAMEQHGGAVVSNGFYQCQPLRCRNWAYGQSELYYHTGSAYGVYNLASYNPNTGCGVVVLTTGASGTTDQYGIYAVCGEITQLLYSRNP